MLIDSPDRALRRAVFARLTSEPSVSTSHIGVTARCGDVTLSGYVTSNAQKAAASAAAFRVKGVGRVTDHVEVALPSALEPDGPDVSAASGTLHLIAPTRRGLVGVLAAE